MEHSDLIACRLSGNNLKHEEYLRRVRTSTWLPGSRAYDCDTRLRVFKTLKEYVKRTETITQDLRDENGKLLISYVKPHREVSKDMIARWLRMFLEKCGVETKRFTAGSVRHAAASMAKALKVPITTIMAMAGWTQEATFAIFHDRSVTEDTDLFQEAVLGYKGRFTPGNFREAILLKRAADNSTWMLSGASTFTLLGSSQHQLAGRKQTKEMAHRKNFFGPDSSSSNEEAAMAVLFYMS
ncbi:hypothetical protein E2C01_053033 [Portunus trituberculatus]|uniref:Tyr recombinase domain-containing protein n=1 Tax=Portunus trituberculatus TaxID=210409 RepID=A0A5B7GP17_PORTR|nr:hypothetical protein [Portunus trituberculatus]